MIVGVTSVRSWMVVLVVGTWGCGVDLLVGGAETGPASSSTTGPPVAETTTTGPDAADSSGTTSVSPGTTGTTTSGGTTTTGPVDEVTSTGMGDTTTGPISCDGLGFRDCIEISFCLWYGEPGNGECALSPCEDKGNDCWALVEEGPCGEAPACAWFGKPGECAPLECAPCEVLTELECNETPTCMWADIKEFCFPVE